MAVKKRDSERKWTKREIAPILISVSGIVISVLAFFLSYSVQNEQEAVRVEGVAVANTLGSTPKGYGIRLSLINDSLRPVIIRSVTLVVDGVRVAPALEYLPDARSLNDQSTRGDEPVRDAVPFPLTIRARGARTIAPLLSFAQADEIFYARRNNSILAGAKEFCRSLGLNPQRSHSIILRVESEPGGATAVPIQMIGPLDGGNQWFVTIMGPRNAPNGVEVRRKFTAASAIRRMTIEISRRGGEAVRRVSLPLFGSEGARFSFPTIGPGGYRLAVLDGGRFVAGSKFQVPLTGRFARGISPSAATTEITQCEVFRRLKERAITPQPPPTHKPPYAFPEDQPIR